MLSSSSSRSDPSTCILEGVLMTVAVIRLRLLSPLGLYPSKDIATSFGRFVIDDDIAFVVTPYGTNPHHEDAGRYSEVEFLTVEEIRFLGCLTVACPELSGILRFYPIPGHIDLILDLMAPRTVFLEAAREQARTAHANSYAAGLVFGPSVGGPLYSRKDDGLDEEIVEQLCEQVNMSTHILIRGLGALIRADMLWARQEFQEPATIMLHISLAATQEMIFDLLRRNGNLNPSSRDASECLALAFGEIPRGDNYFEDFYEDRNIMIHPRSRRGDFSYPPLAADDFYDLRPAVIAVLVWLITGEPPLPADSPNSRLGP